MVADPSDVLARRVPGPDFVVRYGRHHDQIADVRMPPGRPSRPLVIFIHGGFWRTPYDRTHVGPLAVDLARRGYPVAAIEYRRVGQPGGGWPGTFDDVAAAVARVPGLVAAATRLDMDRPVLAGHSAGGHLALWAAGRPSAAIGAVVALAPVADLALAYRMGLGDGAVSALLGGGPTEVPDRYAYGEPGRPTIPTVIVHGHADDIVPVAVSRAYVQRLRDQSRHDRRPHHQQPFGQQAGGCCEATLVELSNVEHYAVIDPTSPAWSTVLVALGADRT
jgi:acetyl esterase/lipase